MLWRSVVERTTHARRTGALQPISTERCFVEDGGVRFVVHRSSDVVRKEAVSTYRTDDAGRTGNRPANPFLPYDQDLFVAEISDTHVALLNKFNVIEHHLLLVTRAFEAQESPLGVEDFEAMWIGMAEHEALAFYNSGVIAGASQRHKHLQVIPLPMIPGGPDLPIDAAIDPASPSTEPAPVPGLPFRHLAVAVQRDAVARPAEAARRTVHDYRAMLRAVGLDPARPGPYNLLATREWMLLVPRSRQSSCGVSINALGFAGSLFVRTESDLDRLRREGPMAVLRSVSGLPARP